MNILQSSSMRSWLLISSLAILALFARSLSAQTDQSNPALPDDQQIELLAELINNARETEGLQPLLFNSSVTQAAQRHSDDMAVHQFLEDIGSDGSDTEGRLNDTGYEWVGYEVLLASGRELDAGRVFDLWGRERGSFDLLIDEDLREIGIGISRNAEGETYYSIVMTIPESCNSELQFMPEIQAQQARQVLELVNAARAVEELPPLVLDDLLNQSARAFSDDMEIHGYPQVPHVASDGSLPSERVTRTGYPWTSVAENILARHNLSAEGAFGQWWDSLPHRENILSAEYTEMGLAFTCSEATGEYFYTQVFARPIEPFSVDEQRQNLFQLVNAARADQGESSFLANKRLSVAAQRHSDDMATGEFFDGVGSDGSTIGDRLDKAGYAWLGYDTQLATGRNLDAEGVLELLLESPEGLDTLFDTDYIEVGVGVAVTGAGDVYYTIILAIPR